MKSGGSKAAEFVLKCLVKIPTRICVSLANKVKFVSVASTFSCPEMGRDARKPIFRVSDQVITKPTC